MSNDPGSARHVDKRMKMAGLGRLRWYCTPCEKQCRTANAFKQHTLSESHARRIQRIGNVNEAVRDFSQQFQSSFLDLLRTTHREKSVHSNHFYQTYIADKQHIHLNATRWHSLTDFVTWLGREGLCRVEDKDDGLFIAWIDRSPEALRRAADLKRSEQAQAADQTREEDFIKAQVNRAHAQSQVVSRAAALKMSSTPADSDRPVAFHLPTKSTKEQASQGKQGTMPVSVFKRSRLSKKRKRGDSPNSIALL